VTAANNGALAAMPKALDRCGGSDADKAAAGSQDAALTLQSGCVAAAQDRRKPRWVASRWPNVGLVGNELTKVDNDIMVLANPEIAQLPGWVSRWWRPVVWPRRCRPRRVCCWPFRRPSATT
jgi:cation/acetate symporter